MKRPETNETRFAEKNTLKRHMESGTLRCDAGITSQAKEGASRESKRDYLHFLYIARGSLSETQYFIHLARRLKYLSYEDADTLHEQTKFVFACLHGLIGSVEKEAGKLTKVVATITSLLVIGLVRFSTGQ